MTFIHGTKANHSSQCSEKGHFVTMKDREKSHHQVRCASLFASLEKLFGCLCIAGGESSQAAGGAEIVSSGAQPCSPSCTAAYPIQGGPGPAETLLENADGAVVLPCGQPCLRAGGYPPLKLPVCSPAGLLCLPSGTIWMVNREERLWEPGGVSLAPKPVAFSSGRAPAIILSNFVPSLQ